MKDRDT